MTPPSPGPVVAAQLHHELTATAAHLRSLHEPGTTVVPRRGWRRATSGWELTYVDAGTGRMPLYLLLDGTLLAGGRPAPVAMLDGCAVARIRVALRNLPLALIPATRTPMHVGQDAAAATSRHVTSTR